MELETYWNDNGRHEDIYAMQWEELVPEEGKCESLQGEVLRAANTLYNKWHNDGEQVVLEDTDPFAGSVLNAWGFLHLAQTLLPESKDRKSDERALLAHLSDLADAASRTANNETGYECILEAIMDTALRFSETRPLIPSTEDMLDGKWSEHCCEYLNY